MIADQLFYWGWQGATLLGLLGLAAGSFLNVVIYRLPVMLKRQWQAQAREVLKQPAQSSEEFNLLAPRSRCRSCNYQITALHNLPVLSWVFLKGRCRQCSAPISVRYPAVELLSLVLAVSVVSIFGYTWLAVAVLLYTWALIALTFIDYDTQLLPDQITLPLLWLGLITNLMGDFVALGAAVAGAAVGYLFLWLIFWAFKLITGKDGMGHGDFKLFGAIGAWVGWQMLPATILIASAAGLLYALATNISGKREASQPIPFGPFLAVAGWVSLIARDTLLPLFLS